RKKKELLERALPILEKHYGSDHYQVADTLESLGNAYGALGDARKKKELLKRSLLLKERYDYKVSLHSAAEIGKLEMVKHLVDNKKVDFNIKDDDGLTPLHKAARTGEFKVVKYLLEKGADLEASDKDGKTP